jgi:hypothetical protein
MEPVGLYYSDWNNDPEGENDILNYMPAIYLKYVREKTNSENLQEFLTGATHVAGVFSGGSLLLQGSSMILRVAGAVEMFNTTANFLFTQNSAVRNKLNATEDGKRFLELWPTISTVTDIATLGAFISSARSSLKQLGDEFGGAERRAVQAEIERAEGVVARGGVQVNTVFINSWTKEGILTEVARRKAAGLAPLNPTEYLSAEYIANHLRQFDDGVVKFLANEPTGAVGPPSGTFVMPKNQADELIQISNGNIQKLEELLGLEKGYLGSNPIRIDIKNPTGLRMPNGNELGANEKWLPGGKTLGGILEATVDQVQTNTYQISNIFK